MTTYKNDFRLGHTATDEIVLRTNVDGSALTLEIETRKSHNGTVFTNISAGVNNNRDGWTSRTYEIYQDYSKTIKKYPEIKRVTSKAIAQAHAISMTLADDFINEAKQQYGMGA
jgi:vancomycin resistance protein YoaR